MLYILVIVKPMPAMRPVGLEYVASSCYPIFAKHSAMSAKITFVRTSLHRRHLEYHVLAIELNVTARPWRQFEEFRSWPSG